MPRLWRGIVCPHFSSPLLLHMKYLSTVVLALAFALTSQAADLSIGVVDMGKVFAEYHKTKSAQAQLAKNMEAAKEQMTERVNALKKIAEEVQKLLKEARDPVLSEQIRAKKGAEYEAKVNEMRSLERDVQEFQQRRQGQLQEEGMQERKKIYDQILAAVSEKAKGDGYDLVFDKSSIGASGLPMLIHAKEGVTKDFTSEVIVLLNKDAPAEGAAAPSEAPAAPSTSKKKK